MDLQASFDLQAFPSTYTKLYNCQVASADLKNSSEIASITGNHKIPKNSNADVISLTFINCTSMPNVPRGIPNQLKSLECLIINNCGVETLSRVDLEGLECLKVLWLDFNAIQHIPSDLLDGFEMIEDISFYSNKISTIDDDFFDRLPTTIKRVDLRKNSDNLDHIFETSKNQNLADFRKSLVASKHSLMSDVTAFLRNNDFRDFTVTINDVEFDVHRFLLEARSPVLGEVIRDNPDVQSLNLDSEVSVGVFEKIVDFLYRDAMPEGDDATMLELFAAASRWKMENLREFSLERVLKSINVKNVNEIFVIAEKFKCEKLKNAAVEVIKESNHLSESVSDEKIEEILHEKRKFDEDIERDLRRIEELRREVEKRTEEKHKWLQQQLHNSGSMME